MHERDQSKIEAEIIRCKSGLEQDIQALSKEVDKADTASERINAIKERAKIRVDLVKLEHEGPEVIAEHDKGQSINQQQESSSA